MKSWLSSMVFFTMAVSTNAANPLGVNIPLTARDPFKVKNFSDVTDDLSKVKSLLDLTGGRIQHNEVVVFFSAFNGSSILLRVNAESDKINIIKAPKFFPVSESESWSVVIKKPNLEAYFKAAKWIADNKIFEKKDIECACAPNIQIYVISSDGISLIEHAVADSNIGVFVDTTSMLMSQKFKNQETEKSELSIIKPMKLLGNKFNQENIDGLVLRPYKFFEYGTETSEVGETQKTFEFKIQQ